MPLSPLSRRQLIQSSMATATAAGLPGAARAATASVGTPLKFPRDAGAHPDFQTEWWYATGFANVAGQAAALGFQITFFRRRVASTQALDSALAAKQLLFAHAAVSDVAGKTLWSDQRIARWSGKPEGANAADPAWASLADTGVVLRDWSLTRTPEGTLRAQVRAADFALDLRLVETQAVLLQGQQGYSRKGPDPAQFSYYYSRPQLQLQGEIRLKGQRYGLDAASRAWLDHGGRQTLASYGIRPPDAAAKEAQFLQARDNFKEALGGHLEFLGRLQLMETSGAVLFVHAGLNPAVPDPKTDREALLWGHPACMTANPLPGRRIVHGHFEMPAPLSLPGRICIDTGAYHSGQLTAVRLDDQEGFLTT